MLSDEHKSEISAIRSELDELIPQVRHIMETNPNFREDEEYQELIGEINLLEDNLREIQINSQQVIDPEIVGQAAVI